MIVETAHRRGVTVSAHVTNSSDLQRALDAGVDDIAHMVTDHVSDKLILRMVAEDVSWVPTLDILDGQGADNLLRFINAGGRVALGNDAGYLTGLEIGMPIRELEAMQAAGMTPMQIILAATRDAAYVCGISDSAGTLEAGKYADILVVDGNPLQDLRALTDTLLVIHRGVIIRNEITAG
jgi:imidazolonepropionase-like amidohydrolase